tara:strand:+ start:5409 stop:6410 length:1002 start_codon:yes stop_codon:yes gene_type:complete
MKRIIEQLLNKENLNQSESREVMSKTMSGEFNDAQIAGFLVALRSKGETAEEIAGFAEAMREKMTPVSVSEGAIDMCGTGGDAKGTFNISTASSLVAAGAGVKIAKHGNRSMTSKSGSADVLTALGVDINLPPEKCAECIEDIGIGFFFAPSFHPAMKHAMGARKSLAIYTVFNILGPLCNPADVKRQLMGIFRADLTDTVAHVLKHLKSEKAFVVHGSDGLDEISTTTATQISHLNTDGSIENFTVSPSDYEIKITSLEKLKGCSPEENARIITKILNGEKGPHRDIVVLNAGAGICVAGLTDTISDGLKLAEESIDSGKAMNTLKRLAEVK